MAKTYDPKDVCIIVGPSIIGGYAKGSFVTVSNKADRYSQKTGADGEAVRSRSHDESGSIKIKLQQTSGSNDVLQGWASLDYLSNAGQFPLMIKDNNGRSLYSALAAWVVKNPDADFADESGDREWTIETDALVSFTGGT
jgi:hypothetical protein